MIPEEIRASLLGEILSAKPLGGGSINEVYKIETSAGIFCLKFNHSHIFPGMFEAEAKGLQTLAATGNIGVPSVIEVTSLTSWSYILLDFIKAGSKEASAMERFGHSLAALHRNTSSLFGLDHNNYMGSLAQSNRQHARWSDFFLFERLNPQVDLAVANGLLDREGRLLFDRFVPQLNGLVPNEPPSLIHGDLWGGNFLLDLSGKAFLIDPAVHFGHRESDLAMTTLFGGFDRAFYRGYQEAFPMEPGWEGRFGIYNLYPLLIHLNLFGSGYLKSILSILKSYC